MASKDVRTNTRVKRYFSITDPEEIQLLSRLSGDELMFTRSCSHNVGEAIHT